jgi:aryl-alcohol dehydrogenase-like predicted oxidoreductase
MATLQMAGKVRHIGVSNFNAQQIERAQKIAPVASLQPPYSLLAREVESEILPYALAHKLGVIVYSPMASGMLTGAVTRERIETLPEDDWRKNSPNFQEPC